MPSYISKESSDIQVWVFNQEHKVVWTSTPDWVSVPEGWLHFTLEGFICFLSDSGLVEVKIKK